MHFSYFALIGINDGILMYIVSCLIFESISSRNSTICRWKICAEILVDIKVQIFWEGHKVWKNLPLKIWHYWVASNCKWKILWPSQNIWTVSDFFSVSFILEKKNCGLSLFKWIMDDFEREFWWNLLLPTLAKRNAIHIR